MLYSGDKVLTWMIFISLAVVFLTPLLWKGKKHVSWANHLWPLQICLLPIGHWRLVFTSHPRLPLAEQEGFPWFSWTRASRCDPMTIAPPRSLFSHGARFAAHSQAALCSRLSDCSDSRDCSALALQPLQSRLSSPSLRAARSSHTCRGLRGAGSMTGY